MKDLMVRTHTFTMLTARLVAIVSFAALLSAAPFHAALAATAPSLGSAADFAVLGHETVTNTGATIVTGNLGVGPGTSCTGFPAPCTGGPGVVHGTIYAGGVDPTTAEANATTAYDALLVQECLTANNLTGKILGTTPGAVTLPPGVYCFGSSAQLTGTLTLNGGPADVWIFKIGTTLTTATNSSVVMSGGGHDTNVFWAVGSSATLGTGTAFTGNILAEASITLTAGASVSGRAIALNGAVTMDTNNVASRCSPEPCLHPLPVPPRGRDVTQLLIDHYLCYQAKPEEKVQPHEVVLQDQFGKRTVTLKRPRAICTPVVKDANPNKPVVGKFPEDLRNPIDHLTCYWIHERGGKDIKEGDDDYEESDFGDNIKEERHGKGNEDREVLMENQFGKTPFTVKEPRLLCVPSLKTLQGDQHDSDGHGHDGHDRK